jgi:hypothetical protein
VIIINNQIVQLRVLYNAETDGVQPTTLPIRESENFQKQLTEVEGWSELSDVLENLEPEIVSGLL